MSCSTYSQLLGKYCSATSNYLKAIEALTKLAGVSSAANFAEAKQECEDCLEECRRTRDTANQHKVRHGCLY